jgi:hypothetical protein
VHPVDHASILAIAARVRLLTADDVQAGPAQAGQQAAVQVASRAPGCGCTSTWMFSPGTSSALAAPRTIPTWQAACPGRNSPTWCHRPLRAGGCRGWSVGVYHPDLDPERHDARQIVNFLAAIIGQ